MTKCKRHQFFEDENGLFQYSAIFKVFGKYQIDFFKVNFNFEEINPLARCYKGAIIEVQETCFSA